MIITEINGRVKSILPESLDIALYSMIPYTRLDELKDGIDKIVSGDILITEEIFDWASPEYNPDMILLFNFNELVVYIIHDYKVIRKNILEDLDYSYKVLGKHHAIVLGDNYINISDSKKTLSDAILILDDFIRSFKSVTRSITEE